MAMLKVVRLQVFRHQYLETSLSHVNRHQELTKENLRGLCKQNNIYLSFINK